MAILQYFRHYLRRLNKKMTSTVVFREGPSEAQLPFFWKILGIDFNQKYISP